MNARHSPVKLHRVAPGSRRPTFGAHDRACAERSARIYIISRAKKTPPAPVAALGNKPATRTAARLARLDMTAGGG